MIIEIKKKTIFKLEKKNNDNSTWHCHSLKIIQFSLCFDDTAMIVKRLCYEWFDVSFSSSNVTSKVCFSCYAIMNTDQTLNLMKKFENMAKKVTKLKPNPDNDCPDVELMNFILDDFKMNFILTAIIFAEGNHNMAKYIFDNLEYFVPILEEYINYFPEHQLGGLKIKYEEMFEALQETRTAIYEGIVWYVSFFFKLCLRGIKKM